ncbi:DUF222 domain-containing protein [Microbacterium sp. ZW T5_56]|uniref:HNH endonuclease signature motif containing protein n=1 Tax=Microbacterium sp. ZW T5_56 TaxID=3378081 RepID=UPI0038519EDD
MTFDTEGDERFAADGGQRAATQSTSVGPQLAEGRQLGPWLATPVVLNSYIDAIAAVTRSRAAADAMEAAMLADLVTLSGASGESSRGDLGLRSLAAEVGAVIHISDRTVQRRMSDAFQLVHEFAAVHAALSAGEILMPHAEAVVNAGAPIPAGAAREEYIERALALARVESPNRLRGMLAQVAEEVREVGITERHRVASEDRTVWVTDDLDGMSTLHAYLPSVLAHGVKDRLDQMAHALRGQRAARHEGDRRASDEVASSVVGGAGPSAESDAAVGLGASVWRADLAESDGKQPPYEDVRTVSQMRADLLADLLLTSTPTSVDTAIGAIRATLAVSVPALTLMGVTDIGAELDGMIPIDADTARQLAGGAAGWDRLVTDPVHGAVLATDRYRPTAEMKRLLTHRHQHCRHPGCRVPVRYTDIDHNHEWAEGGKTDVGNLAPLCRRHHTLKTSAGWSIKPLAGGDLEFVTALDRSHLDILAPRTVGFVPSGPAVDEHSEGAEGNQRPSRPANQEDSEPPW